MNEQSASIIIFANDPNLRKPTVEIAPLGYRKNIVGTQMVVIPDEETAP